MKGSFIVVFLLVELFAVTHGADLQAQAGRLQPTAVKNNFSSFTRINRSRGKLWVAKNKAYLLHPDANLDDQYSPNTKAVEFFEKRTVDSKFFVNNDTPSICYSQWSSSPMHYKKNGQWITIDSRLRPKSLFVYEASNQEDPLGFDIKRKSSYFNTPDGKTYFNNWQLYGENGGTEILLATANWTNYTAGDDGIAIKNIFPGIDAEMKVSRGAIETNFIVHANKFAKYKTLHFRDTFQNGHAGNLSFSSGAFGNGLAAAADFRVSAATVLHINKGVMYLKENPLSGYAFIPFYLDRNELTLAISSELLNSQLKQGDVVIDPLVQDMGTLKKNQITGSQYNQDCSLTVPCKYDFMVPAPAGATLTDAQFTFGYTANFPCVGQDGGFSFGTGTACMSQLYQSNSILPGPQNFPNQSIVMSNGASMASCLPAAVCAAQNIPFSFYFFRKCKGLDGCDGSCIGAQRDLVITIVGRTFDSASLSASALTVCAGSPVTLTAGGFYGVAPYNFTWQGLPQFNGNPVIQVNPTVNTTYTVKVDDACPGKVGAPVSKSISINVTRPPVPALSSNSPVCAGGQLILSAPAVPGTTYYIANPAAGLGGGQYASSAVFNNVTAAYAGTWIAVATDANGCTSDTARTTVVVNPLLTPTVTISSSATTICAGTPVTFTATATNAGNAPTYQWLLNGNIVGTNSPTYTGSGFANNDAISCVVSAGGACTSGSATSNIIVLTVSAAGLPTFDPIGPLCQNSTPPVLPPTSKEGFTGTWNPATINTAAIGTTAYKFTPSAGNCAVPVSINITIASSVTTTFPNLADSYCLNDKAQDLPSTSKEGINGTWSPASINTTTAGSTTYTFTPSAGQCGTTTQITIVVNPLPELTMGDDVTIAPGESKTLNPSVSGNIITYQWKPATGLSNATIRDPVASPTVTTVYTLNVVDDKKCEASGSIRVTVAGTSSKILVPNAFSPNGDGINDTWVITNISAHPGATINVYDRTGQLVFHSENYSKPWDGTLNGNPLPMATYYYVIDLKDNEKKLTGSVTLFK